MKTVAITTTEITPAMMAECFWQMGSDKQAEFFNHLHDVIQEDHKTNPSAYSHGELQWCALRLDLDKPENKRGKAMHMALSAFAYDYFAQRNY